MSATQIAGGPHLVVLNQDGRVTLVVPDAEEATARARGDADEVVAYAAYSYLERLDGSANEWAMLHRVLLDSGAMRGRLGIEPAALPVALGWAMRRTFQALTLGDATPALTEARLVKTGSELERIRAALDLITVGQDAARRLLRDGMTEVELFAGVRGAIEVRARQRTPVSGDLVAGAARTAEGGGWPTGYEIAAGDLVLVDLVPRRDGYWGDSCNTLCAGEPTAEQQRMKRVTVEALTLGIEAIRPGVPAREIDRICREHVERAGYGYAHHTGHGIGVTAHEDPRLVPYETIPLRAGMVLALEPAAYVPGVGGVRGEHVVLVTDDGAEALSSFALDF